MVARGEFHGVNIEHREKAEGGGQKSEVRKKIIAG
jgi:hypothetical protein